MDICFIWQKTGNCPVGENADGETPTLLKMHPKTFLKEKERGRKENERERTNPKVIPRAKETARINDI